jgi:ABC-type transport system substrate-binding protein
VADVAMQRKLLMRFMNEAHERTAQRLLAATLILALTLGSVATQAQPAPAAGPKVLRYAFSAGETGFDPAQISDIYSRTITPHIFEAPYRYDHLARPAKIVPLTADGLPVSADNFRTWTVKIKPGIYFADDPAFKGKKRELTAADYVYAFKRFADPAIKSPIWGGLEQEKYEGLNELRADAIKNKKPFDYDRVIPGVRALDRYTLQYKVAEPRPRFIEGLAGSDIGGAMAREVVEAYGDRIAEHPVGTGPFVLKQWRRSSLIVLEKNPGFREMFYDAEPAADDAQGQALLARFKGRKLPMIDRVEVSIINESQPRWLSFLNGQSDLIERVPPEFINVAMPNGKVAPNLEKQGIEAYRVAGSIVTMTYFNMDDPTVGGYTPEKIALRRAIGLGTDLEREIRLVRRGQAIPAQSPLTPNTTGYDPAFRSENSEYDPARAKALLDLFGYVDKNGDGWRDRPDGSPLTLVLASQTDPLSRQFNELFKRNMDALQLRSQFALGQWPEQLKAARAGKLMMWSVGSSAASPDGVGSLSRMDSAQAGSGNFARFKNKRFDEIYEKLQQLSDGPERLALFDEAKRLAVAYMPYKYHVHSFISDMTHPWVLGYRRPLFWQEYWHWIDIDNSLRPQ